MGYFINLLNRLGFWGFVLTFTMLAIIFSELLILIQSYLLTGNFFDSNLLTVGFFTPLIDGFILFVLAGLLLKQLKDAREDEALLQERLMVAGEASYDLIYEWHVDSDSLQWFGDIDGFLGFEKGEISHNIQAWIDLIHPDDALQLANAVEVHRTSTHPINYQYRIKNHKGEYHYWQDSARPILGSDGLPKRWVGVCKDITREHRTLAELESKSQSFEEQSLLLRTVIDQIPDPLVLKNFDGKFLLTNEACAKLYGTTPEEMIGKDDGDYIPDKELAEFFRQNVQAIMDKGKTQIVYEDSVDVATGEYRHYRSIKQPFKNIQGEPEILVLAQDITALKEAENKLKEKENYQRALLDNFPFMVWLKDTDSRFLALNKAMTDAGKIKTPEQAIGKNDIDLWGEEMAKGYREADQEVMQSGQAVEMEEPFTKENGEFGWLHTYKAPVRDSDGELLGTVGFARDITQQKRALREHFLLQHAIKHSHDAYYLIDNNAQFRMINAAASQDTGYSIEELKLMGVGDIDKVFPLDHWEALWQTTKKTGSTRIETQITRKDGSTYPADIMANFIEYEGEEYMLAFARNVTQQKQNEALLKSERDRFELAIEGTQDGIWDWDLVKNTTFLSDRVYQMLGYEVGEFSSAFDEFKKLIHPQDLPHTQKAMNAHFSGQTEVYESKQRILSKDGQWIWCKGRGKALFDEAGNAVRFVGFMSDISEEIEHEKLLDHTAKHDVLTNLPNRFMLNELLEGLMSRVERNQTQLAILYIDLDGFKEINDQYGHSVGDTVLTQVSHRMKELIRNNDLISRIGGDEFTVVLSDLHNDNEVLPLINRLISNISQTIHSADNDGNAIELQVTISIGVTFYPQNVDIGSDALLRQADQAMYTAKNAGKNTYKFFDVNQSEVAQEQQQKQARIEKAIDNNELILHYQPKVKMDTGKVIGFEALLRWQDPDRGLIYPDDFLPAINFNELLMLKLGDWVFNRALTQLEQWNSQGHNLSVSINVSGHEIHQLDFKPYLLSLLKKYPSINPQQLELEFLETHALEDSDKVFKVIKACQNLGVKVSLDDFGTGYSTLSYLKNLPVNALKIDRSFVNDMLYNSASFSIIEAAMGLAQAFKCETVAEGVEDSDQGIMLLKLGCQVAQGYVIAKPMPADSVLDWLDQWTGIAAWHDVSPVATAYREILYAENHHRRWVKEVENYIKAPDKHELPNLDPKQCQFGLWLESAAHKVFDQDTLKDVVLAHTEIHNLAQQLQYDGVDRQALMLKIKQQEKIIIEQLQTLNSLLQEPKQLGEE